MENRFVIIIVCAVLAAAVVGVGIFLIVHFCCQRRDRRQHSQSRSRIAQPSAARSERPRRSTDRPGRTRSPASRNGGTGRPPLPPSTRPPSMRPGLSSRDELVRENCKEWLLRNEVGGRALVDVHQPPISPSVVSEVSQAAATLNHSIQQHTYQTVPGDSLGRGVDESALEVEACEPPTSPPPPPPPSAETRQQRKQRELRRTQKLFPGVPVKEEHLYELRAIFSDSQLSRSSVAGVPVPGPSVMPHPSSAPPWPPACVQHAAPARTAASAGEGGAFSQWPTATEGDGALVSLVGPVLTDGGGYGSGFCSGDPAAKQLHAAPSQKTGFARPPPLPQPHGSGSSISGIVFSASAAADSTAKAAAAAVTKQRLPDPLAQTLGPNDECRLPDGSPPPPRCVSSAVGGSGSGALPPPPSTECKTCRRAAALGQSPFAEPPPLPPPRPSSPVVVFDARIRCNRDFEQLPGGGERPDLNIANYLRSLPVEVLERRYAADGDCAAAAAVIVATEEHGGSEQLVKPYCLLGPNSLDTS